MKTDNIVPQADPGVFHDIVAYRRPEAVAELIAVPGVQHCAAQAEIPLLGKIVTPFNADQVGIAAVLFFIDLLQNVFGPVLNRNLGLLVRFVVGIQIVDDPLPLR